MNKKVIIAIAAVLLLLLAGAIFFSVKQVTSLRQEVAEAQAQNEQLQITNDQLQLSNELSAINSEFQQYEDQAVKLTNDTILAKYTAAKAKVEQLMKELKQQKATSHAEIEAKSKKIKELQGEIETLRGLLRHYIAQVDSLGKENAGLRAENAEIRTANESLSSQVQEVSQKAEVLSQRMTLAEKLNVTGVSLQALNGKGKNEKNVTKAKQLKVTFTIPQNNSTPVGPKTIYMRLTGPEGSLLGNAGSFSFEGSNVACSAKKTVEYAGDEISGITMYWDVNTTLNPGDYTVELFADNYRLASRRFTLKK
ncbi:MAG: hypothetical protein NC338_03520 [Firmicutes bacterium]|nr:hypothetical protein [Bacillota bacterium]MCM1401305.1 hypothetical protein [Bacteroides sp.]MCM1476740.1 hypothetical protein [Bacteroides sp.]